jgi:hypothetical protein
VEGVVDGVAGELYFMSKLHEPLPKDNPHGLGDVGQVASPPDWVSVVSEFEFAELFREYDMNFRVVEGDIFGFIDTLVSG